MWLVYAVFRIVVLIPLAYAVACFAAGVVFAFAAQVLPLVFGGVFFLVVPLLAAWILAVLAFVPAFLFILLAEIGRWRHVVAYVGWGAVIGLLFCIPGSGLYADLLSEFGLVPEKLPEMAARVGTTDTIAVALVMGITAGLVYWVLAGRYAGFREGDRL